MAPYSPHFERFWSAYPKRVGKGAAWLAFQRATRRQNPENLADVMIEALAWQPEQPQWTKDGGAFIPYPATWINQRRWEDEPFEAAPRPRASSQDCPHEPPCEASHYCRLKLAKEAGL